MGLALLLPLGVTDLMLGSSAGAVPAREELAVEGGVELDELLEDTHKDVEDA